MAPLAGRLVALALLVPLAACTGGNPDQGMESAAGVVLRSVPVDAAAALPSVVAATRKLGTVMLAQAPSGANVVTSPSSVMVALGMLAEGARGGTLAELETVLGASGTGRKDAFAALRGTLLRMDGDPAVVKKDKLPDVPVVHLADQVVVDDAYEVSAGYLASLAEDFGAGTQRVDLASADGKRVLDAWVNRHTGGLIEKSAVEPDPDIRVVVQDAILLAARWSQPFTADSTQPRPFTLADGTQVDAETMASSRSVAYAEADGWQAVRLPYQGEALHADFILPPAGTDPAKATPELLARLGAALDASVPVELQLTLPTLDVKPDASDLAPAVQQAGAPSLWCGAPTDLTGIGPEDLCISQMVQQAMLKVDEEGTIAAAVTEAVGTAGAAPSNPVKVVHFDRPYLMQIASAETSWPLFLAAIRDPRH